MNLRTPDYATYGSVVPVHSAVNNQDPMMGQEEWNIINRSQKDLHDLLNIEVVVNGESLWNFVVLRIFLFLLFPFDEFIKRSIGSDQRAFISSNGLCGIVDVE